MFHRRPLDTIWHRLPIRHVSFKRREQSRRDTGNTEIWGTLLSSQLSGLPGGNEKSLEEVAAACLWGWGGTGLLLSLPRRYEPRALHVGLGGSPLPMAAREASALRMQPARPRSLEAKARSGGGGRSELCSEAPSLTRGKPGLEFSSSRGSLAALLCAVLALGTCGSISVP